MAPSKKHSSAAAKTKPSSLAGKDKVCNGQDYDEGLVGSKIRVWWPLDRQFYQGVVDSFNSAKKKHLVLYEDGEKETLNMKKERWELIEEEEDDASADEISLQDESDNERSDATPEPVIRKSARSNGKMGDVGGKIVAAASRMRTGKKISEATNRRQTRASSSSSKAVSDKVTKPRTSSKKNKRNETEDKDGGVDDDSKKNKRKKTEEEDGCVDDEFKKNKGEDEDGGDDGESSDGDSKKNKTEDEDGGDGGESSDDDSKKNKTEELSDDDSKKNKTEEVSDDDSKPAQSFLKKTPEAMEAMKAEGEEGGGEGSPEAMEATKAEGEEGREGSPKKDGE